MFFAAIVEMEHSKRHRNTGACSVKRHILPVLYIAQRVTGHGVNSNAAAAVRGLWPNLFLD